MKPIRDCLNWRKVRIISLPVCPDSQRKGRVETASRDRLKVTFMGEVSGVWTKIRKDVVYDSGLICAIKFKCRLRSPLLLDDHEMTKNCPPIISSLQSAPERDECTGDPVPD